MFALARRSPFEWMEQMDRHMDALLGRSVEPNGSTGSAWTPDCDVYARDGKVVVRCDVPGVDPGDVHVVVRGRTLTISGERRATEQIPDEDYCCREIPHGSFERAVTLPADVDAQAITASYRNGVLAVEVPLPKELTAQTVPITVEQPALAPAA